MYRIAIEAMPQATALATRPSHFRTECVRKHARFGEAAGAIATAVKCKICVRQRLIVMPHDFEKAHTTSDLIFFGVARPPKAFVAAFDFTERRHVPLAAP